MPSSRRRAVRSWRRTCTATSSSTAANHKSSLQRRQFAGESTLPPPVKGSPQAKWSLCMQELLARYWRGGGRKRRRRRNNISKLSHTSWVHKHGEHYKCYKIDAPDFKESRSNTFVDRKGDAFSVADCY